jgi:hypothetical protein
MSLASSDAAAARHRAAARIDDFNLHLGPTAWAFSSGLSLEANDNIRLEPADTASDLILHPHIDTRILWPVSEKNSLTFALGAGYSAYVQHPEFDRFFIRPGSELSFDLYAGDFWFNLHDRFSIFEDTYQDPTIVGSADYSRLENALGITSVWDLNKALVKLGYDHVNYLSLQGASPYPDGASEVFSASTGLRLLPELLAGLETGGSLSQYASSSPLTAASQWSVGAFAQAQVSDHLQSRLNVGYTVNWPEGPSAMAEQADFSGLYALLDISHRLNQHLDYTIDGGRTITCAFSGGTVEMYYARLQLNAHFIRKVSLGASFQYEDGTQLGFTSEHFQRFGPALSVSRSLTAKLTGSLAYQYYLRNSDISGRDYDVNVVSLDFAYKF